MMQRHNGMDNTTTMIPIGTTRISQTINSHKFSSNIKLALPPVPAGAQEQTPAIHIVAAISMNNANSINASQQQPIAVKTNNPDHQHYDW